jgi:hypothetical protein
MKTISCVVQDNMIVLNGEAYNVVPSDDWYAFLQVNMLEDVYAVQCQGSNCTLETVAGNLPLVDDTLVQAFEDFIEKELARQLDVLKNEMMSEDAVSFLKEERNGRLASTDWTQSVDSPLSAVQKTEWALYRQALRDMPANNPDPQWAWNSADKYAYLDVVWPTKPT